MKRRMSYRMPEKKFEKVNERLGQKGIDFEEFVDQIIDLYLNEKLDPKGEVDDWGTWMESK